MHDLLTNPDILDWVSQFDEHEQANVIEMLKHFRLVSRDEFANGIKDTLTNLAIANPGLLPMGLYAERDTRTRQGRPNRLFKESSKKPVRAFGGGPSPIKPTRSDAPEVGSEGIVGNLITEICRSNRSTFISHPGPNLIRKKKIRSFVIVADIIGSGRRTSLYLESAWRIASVKSWHSLKLLNFIIVSFTATQKGSTRLRNHSSTPLVKTVTACPTITDLPSELAERCRDICRRYDPKPKRKNEEGSHLGYQRGGALIAFAHGCPNNVPNIFHYSGGPRQWKALFPHRVNPLPPAKPAGEWSPDAVIQQLTILGLRYEHASALVRRTHKDGHQILLFLQATRRGPKEEDALARRTELSVLQIRKLRDQALQHRWISVQGRLTDSGASQLRTPRATKIPVVPVSSGNEIEYYPKALRAPCKV